MKKVLFIIIGIISVVLGVIGVFVPGLPTTPFLLLSSWLFYKSSKRLHDRLQKSPLGKYIRRYESRKGVSWCSKFFSLVCMWTMVSISAFLLIDDVQIRILLLILAGLGTASILFLVPGQKTLKVKGVKRFKKSKRSETCF